MEDYEKITMCGHNVWEPHCLSLCVPHCITSMIRETLQVRFRLPLPEKSVNAKQYNLGYTSTR